MIIRASANACQEDFHVSKMTREQLEENNRNKSNKKFELIEKMNSWGRQSLEKESL